MQFEKLGKWIYSKVGIKNLYAATVDEWQDWRKESKQKSPKIYWLIETGFPAVWDFLCIPYEKYKSCKHFLYNGFVAKEHVLKTKFKFGEYHSISDRILHANFETLVDFLEREKAWHSVLWDEEIRAKYKKFFYLKQYFDFGQLTCFPASHDYLQWEIALKNDDGTPTHQAIKAKEHLDLYYWWKIERPARIEPFSDDSIDNYLKEKYGEEATSFMWYFSKNSIISAEDRQKYSDHLDESSKLEDKYQQEDEDMLIRLIKARDMWT